MRYELKYATILLLIVFINTISLGGYIRIMKFGATPTYSISQKSHDRDRAHTPYNLYVHTLKEFGTDKCTDDQKNRAYVRHIVDFSILQILTKSYVATNTPQVSIGKIKSNDYYVFALRKIVV